MTDCKEALTVFDRMPLTDREAIIAESEDEGLMDRYLEGEDIDLKVVAGDAARNWAAKAMAQQRRLALDPAALQHEQDGYQL